MLFVHFLFWVCALFFLYRGQRMIILITAKRSAGKNLIAYFFPDIILVFRILSGRSSVEVFG